MRTSTILTIVIAGMLAGAVTVAEGKPVARATITVRANPAYPNDPRAPKCLAELDGLKRHKAKRTQVVEWRIRQPLLIGRCSYYMDVEQVSLDFASATKGTAMGQDPVPTRTHYENNKIVAIVAPNAMDLYYGYDIKFDNVVSEDPELEIDGYLGPLVP